MRTIYDELFGFRREVDEMFNRILGGRPFGGWAKLPAAKPELTLVPAIETYIDKEAKKFVCRVTLPGVEPKDFQVNVQGNLLMIRGERKFARGTKEIEFIEQEVAYGFFERTLVLPEGVVAEKLTAEYLHGVLEITAPMAAAVQPRKIEIKATEPVEKQIAA